MTAGLERTPDAPPSSLVREWALRTGAWLLLGTWVGSWLLFPWVALTAFRSLPSTELAGRVVGPVLTALHLYGAAAGLALALLARALRRGAWAIALPLALSALCLYSQFGVSAEIDEIRSQVFAPGGNEGAAARFNLLHRRSVGIFSAVGAGALVLIGVHSRVEGSSRGPHLQPARTASNAPEFRENP